MQPVEEKKYLWLDGKIRSKPDPDWTEEKAIKLGLIKKPSAGQTFVNPGASFQALQKYVQQHELWTGQGAEQIKPD
ncbi:hypothetical protein KBC75_02360 [Candidatus Shapirobacteria bacterium]|nr:hypothetical protein [Candidatus Shapirobacteria bacterium]